MSDNADNYTEETKPLFRLLRTEAFRFIIARYDHYSLITKLKEGLEQQFPDRPVVTVDARGLDYRTLVDRYYELGRGFYIVENFEVVLNNPELYTGLNQRRDKLATYPIALFGLISTTPEEQFARRVMEKMPDLWSFRSIILDLKSPIISVTSTEGKMSVGARREDDGAMFKQLQQKDEGRLLELEKLLARTGPRLQHEHDLAMSLYSQIAKVYRDLGDNRNAIEYYGKAIASADEMHDLKSLSYYFNEIGVCFERVGEWDKALEYYLKSEKICIETGDNEGLGTAYNHIGIIYRKKGDWDKALEHNLKSEKICIETRDKAGLAVTYNNIGLVYSYKGELDKAMEYYLKSEKIHIEAGDNAGLAPTYNNIGSIYSNKGEWDKALEHYIKSEIISIEAGDKAGLAYTYFNIGTVLQSKGDQALADQFIILAGFIAKQLGMKHELSQWAWALEPLLKQLGEKKFMETGERLYAERLLQQK